LIKNKFLIIVSVLVFLASGFLRTGHAANNSSKEPLILKEGTYTAHVKAIVCSGCGPFIENTLKETDGIGTVAVYQATKTVSFKVCKGHVIKLVTLQKNLKSAADEMGMGADYSLTDVKPVEK